MGVSIEMALKVETSVGRSGTRNACPKCGGMMVDRSVKCKYSKKIAYQKSPRSKRIHLRWRLGDL